jgi:uncharacterized protein (DUF427 family)
MTETAEYHLRIVPYKGRVQVRWRGAVIAETTQALRLEESRHEPVYYIPRADAQMAMLERTSHTTRCPHKGVAHYFSLVGKDGARAENAVWTYETPISKSAPIKEHLAFYTDAMRPGVGIDIVVAAS